MYTFLPDLFLFLTGVLTTGIGAWVATRKLRAEAKSKQTTTAAEYTFGENKKHVEQIYARLDKCEEKEEALNCQIIQLTSSLTEKEKRIGELEANIYVLNNKNDTVVTHSQASDIIVKRLFELLKTTVFSDTNLTPIQKQSILELINVSTTSSGNKPGDVTTQINIMDALITELKSPTKEESKHIIDSTTWRKTNMV